MNAEKAPEALAIDMLKFSQQEKFDLLIDMMSGAHKIRGSGIRHSYLELSFAVGLKTWGTKAVSSATSIDLKKFFKMVDLLKKLASSSNNELPRFSFIKSVLALVEKGLFTQSEIISDGKKVTPNEEDMQKFKPKFEALKQMVSLWEQQMLISSSAAVPASLSTESLQQTKVESIEPVVVATVDVAKEMVGHVTTKSGEDSAFSSANTLTSAREAEKNVKEAAEELKKTKETLAIVKAKLSQQQKFKLLNDMMGRARNVRRSDNQDSYLELSLTQGLNSWGIGMLAATLSTDWKSFNSMRERLLKLSLSQNNDPPSFSFLDEVIALIEKGLFKQKQIISGNRTITPDAEDMRTFTRYFAEIKKIINDWKQEVSGQE